MNRPNNGQRRGGKPPPPVPPRPSKSVVAEALAKSRQFKSPTRQAPPPPPATGVNEIVKSKSSYSINIPLKKPPVFERSISEEVKNQGRPVIYQSPNVKCNTLDHKTSVSTKTANYVNHCINNFKHSVVNNINNSMKNTVNGEEVKVKNGNINVNNKNVNVNNNIVNVNSNKIKITRKSSDVKIVSRSNSLKTNSTKSEEIPVPKPRNDPSKRNSYCGDKFVEKIVKIEDSSFEIKNDDSFYSSKSNSSTLEKSCDSSTTSSSRSSSSTVDKKNWDQLLNDRNHVNTLIDEMFASVLEVSPSCDEDEGSQEPEICIDNTERNCSIAMPPDTTKIIVRSDSRERLFQEIPANITPQDNKVVISNNLGEVSCSTSVTSVEMLPKTVIVITNGDDSADDNISNNSATRDRSGDESNFNSVEREKQVKFKDQQNHELLINELQCMQRDQEKILKRQRKPSMNIYGNDENGSVKSENGYAKIENASPKVRRPDTLDIIGSGGGEVRIKTKFVLNSKDTKEDNSPIKEEKERLSAMSSLQHGLPPLPKSLSGFNLTTPNHHPPTPPRSSSIRAGGIPSGHLVYPTHPSKPADILGNSGTKKSTGLDAKLAILRQEMYSLRQLDLSLLSQLWSLNESIQDFRQMLQEQEERVLSPPSPSPTPSSGDEEFYVSATSLNFRPSSVTTQTSGLVRRQSTSSNGSSLGG